MKITAPFINQRHVITQVGTQMTFKHFTIHTILLGSCLSLASPIFAESASLSNELALHIPVIKYQDQYLWADLDYMSNSDGDVYFKLRHYGSLTVELTPPSVNALSQVTEGEPPRVVDISSAAARLTFTSSVPLACSVVFGKTMGFGSVATDSNMNGGAIIEHNPILTNLDADSEYYYRVQGSDAQGNLYWGPTSSFMTSSVGSQRSNFLALSNGASITAVSSNFGGGADNQSWGANSAIDSSAGTAWSSAGDGDAAFIQVGLAETKHIDTLRVWSRSMSDGSAKILSFTVTIDDSEVLGPFRLPDTQKAYDFDINRMASSIRLDVNESTGGNTGFVELEAF